MMDSNQFHATCLDTFPPIFYMNDVSRVVVAAVHALNKASGRNLCAYTFDAGPNAVISSPALQPPCPPFTLTSNPCKPGSVLPASRPACPRTFHCHTLSPSRCVPPSQLQSLFM